MMRSCVQWILLASTISCLSAADANFDRDSNSWAISNDRIRATFQLTEAGTFAMQALIDLSAGAVWAPPAGSISTPIQFQAGAEIYDATRTYTLVDQYVAPTAAPGLRQVIVLEDTRRTARFTLSFDVYDGQPVLRYRVRYRNLTSAPMVVTSANLLPWSFADLRRRYVALRVNQWSLDSRPGDFETLQSPLDPEGTSAQLTSGAHGQQCGWLAVRDAESRGLFAGWEFDGRAKASVRHLAAEGSLELSAAILDLHHPVESGAEFVVPTAFLGLFHGDFDEAGFRTQRFVESILAKPAPVKAFPYVSWDSWGYEDRINEDTLRRNAELAAKAGVELFVVDLGWARAIGDWTADPEKFPNGLGALADYVHSLGMKFGLHFALAEAAPSSPVLQANPDWTASVSDGYHGALSLCLAHQSARDWVVQQAIRLIDEYHVDWILQDGENMVKECAKSTHTHDPAD